MENTLSEEFMFIPTLLLNKYFTGYFIEHPDDVRVEVCERFETHHKGSKTQIIQDSQGFTYAFARKNQDCLTWRCSKQYRAKCRAYIHTSGDYIIRKVKEHNHV